MQQLSTDLTFEQENRANAMKAACSALFIKRIAIFMGRNVMIVKNRRVIIAPEVLILPFNQSELEYVDPVSKYIWV